MAQDSRISLGKALLRGVLMRCPSCGKGRMFGRFLKVVDCCGSCGEEMHHHQADDYPAYIVIALLGHPIFAIILSLELTSKPPVWLYLVVGLPVLTVTALGMLQPVKGAVVALQWYLGLHGFEAAKFRRAQNASAVSSSAAQ